MKIPFWVPFCAICSLYENVGKIVSSIVYNIIGELSCFQKRCGYAKQVTIVTRTWSLIGQNLWLSPLERVYSMCTSVNLNISLRISYLLNPQKKGIPESHGIKWALTWYKLSVSHEIKYDNKVMPPTITDLP